jgi:mediator of RNA polymerase II transcription subunit 31
MCFDWLKMNQPDKTRFMVELEFVQLLANPSYINCISHSLIRDLAQNKYFEDKKFLNYLIYLKYWKNPIYSKYITYPHCLYFLDHLNESESFRDACKNMDFINFVSKQQGLHWQHYRRNRESSDSKE